MWMPLVVDALLAAIVLASLISGWRQGAFSSVISAIGIVSGLVIGLAIAPVLLSAAETQRVRVLLLFADVVFFVGLGNLVGATIGGSFRESVRTRGTRVADSVLGAMLQSVAVGLVVWFISLPLAASMPGALGDGIRSSRVLATIDAATPDAAAQLPAKFAALLDESGLPPLVSPFQAPGDAEVDAPNQNLADPELIKRLRPSVVHVMGDAESCSRRLRGSGFVIAEDYVLTNAHVVAGTERVALDTVIGVKPAEVVLYDPSTDIAVLRSTELGLPELNWAPDRLQHGDDALVLGYPASGPFKAEAARIRAMLNISGPDIYTTGRVEREAYTIRGEVRQGNSGGPLMTADGHVAGMIFGASMDTLETGYALTARQVQQRVGEVTGLQAPVDTGACVSG